MFVRALFPGLVFLCALHVSGTVWGTAIVMASLSVQRGPGDMSTITATFSLRQGATSGVKGGQTVTLSVDFWEDDTWPCPNDPIGCTTVSVVLPDSGDTTGPFTTPGVVFDPDTLGDFFPDYRATVKGGSGVAGVEIEDATSDPMPGGTETDRALGFLTPSADVLSDPVLTALFGDGTGLISLTSNDCLTIDLRNRDDESSVPTLPSTGLPFNRYEAQITGSSGEIVFSFPTAGGVPDDGENASFTDDLTYSGFPAFQWVDVSSIGTLQSVEVCVADSVNPPVTILEAIPFSFMRGDANGDGQFGLPDALFTLNARFVPGSRHWPCLEAADADHDALVNGLQDALYSLTALFLFGPPPPAPFPGCGPDPSQLGNLGNTLGCAEPPAGCNPPARTCRAVNDLSCASAAADVSLSWQNGGDYDAILVLRDSNLVQILPGDATGFTDPDQVAGTYTYGVRGDCGAGSSDVTVSCQVAHMPTTSGRVINSWGASANYIDLTIAGDVVVLASPMSGALTTNLLGEPSPPFTIPDPATGATRGIFYDGQNLGWLKESCVVVADLNGNPQNSYCIGTGDFHGATYDPQNDSIWTYNCATQSYEEYEHLTGIATGNSIENPCGPGSVSGGIAQVPGCLDVICGNPDTDTIFRCDGQGPCRDMEMISVGSEITAIAFHETGSTDTPVLYVLERTTETVYEVERNP